MTQLQSTPSQGVPPFFFVSVILILVSYIGVDITVHITEYLSRGSLSTSAVDAMKLNQGDKEDLLSSWQEQEDRFCSTVLGHLPDHKLGLDEDPWKQMKWIGKPARCKVKGQLIESLDDTYDFRRGFSLKYIKDAEDRTHILPWLLGSNINLNSRKRRVYLDLGANSFQTSIEWFMLMYPCDFTEIHALEADDQLLDFPEVEGNYEESENYAPDNDKALRVKERLGIPQWMLNRMRFYYIHVADGDEYSSSSDGHDILSAINITHFMKEGLKLTMADTVVVKMDIEGREWPILQRWLTDPQMAEIVDELFVEIHYNLGNSSRNSYGGTPHTREQATRLIADLRSKNFFVHVWP